MNTEKTIENTFTYNERNSKGFEIIRFKQER